MRLRVLAVRSGQALKLLERGDVDVAITHDPDSESDLLARDASVKRIEIMTNAFVIVGPAADPARVHGRSLEEALAAIARGRHPFVSRGDDSGTHRAERRLWKAACVEPSAEAYREAGQGMGETLVMAGEMSAYTLADEATFATFRERVALVSHVSGDPRLLNRYAVLWRSDSGMHVADWLCGDSARALMPPLFEPAR